MTDISVIKMIISVAVWRIYLSWLNDKLRAWEGFGHSRMFWARLSRDDFRSKLEIISFLSRVMSVSKSFCCFPRFWRFGAKLQALRLLVSTMPWRSFWKLRSVTGHFFANSDDMDYDHKYFFENFLSFSQNRAGGTCLTAVAIPKLSKALWWWNIENKNENLTSVRWRDRAQKDHGSSSRLARVVCGNPWSKRKKKTQGSQRVIVRRLNPSSSTNQRVLSSLFPRPDVATVSHFAVFADVVVQLQDSQAAARGKRRKAVIRDISGIDHWGVTNLSAPISFAVQGHCNVFRHVMQLSLLVLCWKSTLAVILPEIKNKRSLSNVGHRGTKAEHLAWHSTG